MKKKLLSVLLAASMAAGLLVGCASEKETSEDPEKETSEDPEKETSKDSEKELSAEEQQLIASIPDEIPDLSGYTFTVLTNPPHWTPERTYEEGFEIFNFIEKLTGCEIDISATNEYSTVLQTRLVSGDPLDVYLINGSEIKKTVDEGLIINIADYWDELPLLKEWYDKFPDYVDTYGYDGGIYAIPTARFDSAEDGAEGSPHTIIYREDIAKELGFDESPKTIEDWYEMLTAVKAAYPAMIPYAVTGYYSTANAALLNHFAASWGIQQNHNIYNEYFVDEDGNVQLSAATDAMEAFVTEMNKWYSEGLIGIVDSWNDALQGNVFSVWYDMKEWSQEANLEALRSAVGRDDAGWTAAPIAAVEGYEKAYGANLAYMDRAWCVLDSGDEERNMAVLKFLEFTFFSKVGDGLNQMGVMGEDSWWFDADGNYVLADDYIFELAATPEDSPLRVSGYKGWIRTPQNNSMMEPYATQYKEWQQTQMSEDAKKAAEVSSAVLEENMQYAYAAKTYLFLPDDVADHITTLTGDITSYSTENINSFITGDRSLAEWDDYIDELYEDLDLQEVLDVYQALEDEK